MTFAIGDTVLVTTGILKTSVAVITGLWEIDGELDDVELELSLAHSEIAVSPLVLVLLRLVKMVARFDWTLEALLGIYN